MDLPGFGRSDKPITQYSIDFFSKVLEEFIQLRGYNEVILIGHSLGGLIAQKITIQNPKLVKKLILISTPTLLQSFRNKLVLLGVNIIFKLGYSNFLKNTIKRIYSTSRENKKIKQQIRYAIRIPKRVVLSSFYHMTYKLPLKEKLPEISQPTLILYGTEDRIISKSEIISLGNLVSNSETRLLENGPHRLMVENHESVNKLIDEFITE